MNRKRTTPPAICLMSDWGLHPFYVMESGGVFGGIDLASFKEMFDLPDDVVQSLLDWDQIYQDILDWEDPLSSGWPSRKDEEAYVEAGRRAARLLRQYIPVEVDIKYLGADNIAPEYY